MSAGGTEREAALGVWRRWGLGAQGCRLWGEEGAPKGGRAHGRQAQALAPILPGEAGRPEAPCRLPPPGPRLEVCPAYG